MKILKLSILLIIWTHSGFAQEGFIDGVIVTIHNDTILCKVPKERSFDKRVPIISNETGKKQFIKTSEIEYLVTELVSFQNVKFKEGNREVQKLMEIFCIGAINLYFEHVVLDAPTPTVFVIPNRARHQIRAKATIYSKKYSVKYVLNKNGRVYFLSKENFKEVLLPLIDDYTELKAKVERESYRYEHIKYIIDAYNKYNSLDRGIG